MRILFVTPYLPHPRSGHGSGDHLYGLVRHFARFHEVTLASFADAQEERLAADLRAIPLTLRLVPRPKGRQATVAGTILLVLRRLLQVARSIVRWEPYYVSKYHDPAMAAVIREETSGAPYDIVQIEFTFMGQYAPCVRSGRTVLRAHDLAYRPAYRNAKRAGSLPARAWAALEWCRWARYEPAVALAHDHVFTVTEQDRALLERLAPGVSASYQAMGLDVPEEVRPFERRERSALLFVGALGHAPNADAALWLASEIFPIVRGRIPDAVLRIAGRGASPALLAAAARNPGIELLGFVDDLASVLWSASVFVAPLRSGGGIKTKIIQAMGYGMPVVTTPVGAEGIEGAQAAGLLLGRSARELAEGVLTLLADPRGAAARAARGRALVLEEYTWERTGRRQEQRYESLLSQQPS